MEISAVPLRASQNAWLLYLLEHLYLVSLMEAAEITEGQTKLSAFGYFIDVLLELFESLHATCNGTFVDVARSCWA